MGNILRSDGMVNDSKATKICQDCQKEFEGWSEEARCIKGKMPAQPYCYVCQAERNKSFQANFSSMFPN